jgi:hypothetical protein
MYRHPSLGACEAASAPLAVNPRETRSGTPTLNTASARASEGALPYARAVLYEARAVRMLRVMHAGGTAVNRHTITTLLGAAALSIALVGASATISGSEQAQPPAQPKAQAQSIEGELVEVSAGMLTVKSSAGEVEIRYNEQTQVSGAQGGVAGLASAKNRRVRVEFTEDEKTKAKTATRITVAAQ